MSLSVFYIVRNEQDRIAKSLESVSDVADEIVAKDYDPEWIHIDAVGPAQVKHEIRYFRSVFPDLKYDIVEINGEEDRVWIRYKARGTQKGTAWGEQ